ncbi:MAG: glycerol-3-phosphate 1-O-acyltransferase PlsY [Solobacterium sp.]|nr:glycerol-3-phosphate 1-O-acyltransferase PlsY [Solobacterium sp.]
MKVILTILISYLFGSVPWALVIGKVFYHKDIRTEGSGNLGASNAGRVLGKKAAVAVTVLDALKSFFSMLIANMLAPQAVLFAGLACCIGHCFPVFANFKGGKAVATAYGFFLGISALITHQYFWNFLFPIIVFFAVLYLTKMVSVSSLSAILSEAVVCVAVNRDMKLGICVLLLWAFITYRHRSNLERVKNGTENKIRWMG